MNTELIKNNTKSFFDQVAESGETFTEAEKGQIYLANRVKEKIKEGSKILDVGCGEGKLLKLLSKDCNYKLYGIDLSKKTIQKAKKELNNEIEFVYGDVDDLPYGDSEYDLLICSHSFHHYPNPSKSLSEMYRVLKNTGELWIIENDANMLQRIKYNLHQALQRHPAGDVKKYSHREICKLAKKAGFQQALVSKATDKGFLMVAQK